MVPGGLGRRAWNIALLASLTLASLAAASSPVMSHGTATPGEKPGHDKSASDPLNAFQWFGPEGSIIEDVPCPPAQDRYVGSSHIGHIYAFEGINPEEGNWLESGSTDFWHQDGYEDQHGAEGPYPGGQATIMYGYDGFARSKFTGSVVDGAGYDMRVYDFHGWSSYCLYGGIEKNGPFFFLGTAFQNQPECEGQYSCMNMAFIYRDLYQEYYNTTATPKMDYLFGVASVERFRGLRADFKADPSDQPSGWSPGTTVQFTDQSLVYGFPDPSSGQGGIVTDTEMMYTAEDPIVEWLWYFDTDPSATSDIARCGAYCYSASDTDTTQYPSDRFYAEVGRYEVCLVVVTEGIPEKNVPPDKDDECKNYRVRDAEPIAAFSIQQRGCFFPATIVTDRSFEPPNSPVSRMEWDFGDGFQAKGPTVEHVYKTSNRYTIRLTVYDNDGDMATIERTIDAIGSDECGNPPDRSLNEGSGANGAPSDGSLSGDYDGDGIPDEQDDCPAGGSAETGDLDNDGVGDGCDEDLDGDLVDNRLDTCPSVADLEQLDLDQDMVGDACDLDADSDGMQDVGGTGRSTDNCRLVANADQKDMDGDEAGDACDDDADGDLVPNLQDAYPADKTRWSDALHSYGGASLKERGDAVQVFGVEKAVGNPVLVGGAVAAAVLAVLAGVMLVRRKQA